MTRQNTIQSVISVINTSGICFSRLEEWVVKQTGNIGKLLSGNMNLMTQSIMQLLDGCE